MTTHLGCSEKMTEFRTTAMYSSRKICFFRLHYQTAALDVIGKRENFFFPTERYAIKHVNYVMYEVCSNNIWIGVVVVVHWEGCVCNQS